MRILVDYRAALRARTGVGEYTHGLIAAYTAAYTDTVEVFTSSWKDRPAAGLAAALRVRVIDRRIPVRLLNLLWHRAEWPPIEWLAGTHPQVVHAAHPLLIPARRAAQVVTIHDLFFLSHPERTRAEIRRDYPALARAHARRADAVITSSRHVAGLISSQLGVDPERVYVCPPGAPEWPGPRPMRPRFHLPAGGCTLFIGTLEPRKNIGGLLDAYVTLLGRVPDAPPLLLVGGATPDAEPWLARLDAGPLRGRAFHLGYVDEEERQALLAQARVLVLPSFDEGFGLPALEAMAAGVPVVASRRGALPEVVADGGTLVDPERPGDIAAAMARLLTDPAWAAAQADAGRARARTFTWAASAATLRQAYADAIERRARR